MPDSLPPDLQAIIRAKVESGHYASEEDVVRAALLALDAHEDDPETERWIKENHEELRAAIQEGVDSGDAGEFILEEFIEEARRRWDAAGYSKP